MKTKNYVGLTAQQNQAYQPQGMVKSQAPQSQGEFFNPYAILTQTPTNAMNEGATGTEQPPADQPTDTEPAKFNFTPYIIGAAIIYALIKL